MSVLSVSLNSCPGLFLVSLFHILIERSYDFSIEDAATVELQKLLYRLKSKHLHLKPRLNCIWIILICRIVVVEDSSSAWIAVASVNSTTVLSVVEVATAVTSIGLLSTVA